MKHFYKGDVIVKKDDAFGRWAVTPGQRFFVVSSAHNVDDWMLLYRPFKNTLKHMCWIFYHKFLMIEK